MNWHRILSTGSPASLGANPVKHGLTRRVVLSAGLSLGFAGGAAAASEPLAAQWANILRYGRGQRVAFAARVGDERTNAFIVWASGRVRDLYGVEVRHVKLRDTAEAVTRLAAEKAAGRTRDGSADLVWAAGQNLLTMRSDGLLDGPVLDLLPGSRLVARERNPSTTMVRMVPLDGYAVPWRVAQLVFIHDMRSGDEAPANIPALLDWALRNPGRLTHPGVRDACGVAFLEQALRELVPDAEMLHRPVTPGAFATATAPLWNWYERLRPALWQGGKVFPTSQSQLRGLMKDGKIDLAMSLDPAEAVMAIAAGTLPPTARAYVLEGGTIGHCSFLAVPFNAAHREGALLLANFLLSPEAQARASDPRFLGVPTVLAMDRLSADDYVFFDAVPRAPNLLSDAERGVPLREPHASWVNLIIEAWDKRYAA